MQIDKNVPLPARKIISVKSEFTQIVEKLEITDSFHLDNVTQQKLSGKLGRIASRDGKKFATRKEGSGVRVWRIA
jgi:hypothetical protein